MSSAKTRAAFARAVNQVRAQAVEDNSGFDCSRIEIVGEANWPIGKDGRWVNVRLTAVLTRLAPEGLLVRRATYRLANNDQFESIGWIDEMKAGLV